MGKTLQVHVVTPQEWSRLAKCPHVSDDDSAGFSDPTTGQAYVRDTQLPALNRYLIQHEFDHLLEEEATDECACGLRHKKGKDIFRNVAAASLAPFTGGLSLSAGSEKFRGEVSDIIPNELKGGEGFLGGIPTLRPDQNFGSATRSAAPALGAAALTLALGPLGGAAKIGSALKTVGAGASRAPLSAFGGSAPAAASGGTSSAASTLTQQGLRLGQIAGSTAAGGGGGGAGFAIPRLTSTAAGLSQPLFGGGGTAVGGAGAGGSTLGSLFGGRVGSALTAGALLGVGGLRKTPDAPELTALPSVQAAFQPQEGGQSALGRLAQTRLTEQLGSNFQGLPEAVSADVRRTFDRRRQEIASQFKTFRPNADLATDTAYRQAIQDVDREEAATLGNLELQENARFNQFRRQDIATALGVDEQTLGQLAQLAQLDVAQIAAQLQIDSNAAAEFKQTFGSLAGIFAANAAGLNAFPLPTR